MFTMDLFAETENSPIKIVNHDGLVEYHGVVLPFEQADKYFKCLLNTVEWRNDQANYFGKVIVTKRKVAWYADNAFNYTYSNTTKIALPWTDELKQLKAIVEDRTGHQFNACLLNLYHNGDEGMTWHSDGEKDLLENGAIASLSLGAERNFSFKHKRTQETLSVSLQNGSLLVMKGPTQKNWLHRLPPTKKVKTARINLTFRTIKQQ